MEVHLVIGEGESQREREREGERARGSEGASEGGSERARERAMERAREGGREGGEVRESCSSFLAKMLFRLSTGRDVAMPSMNTALWYDVLLLCVPNVTTP